MIKMRYLAPLVFMAGTLAFTLQPARAKAELAVMKDESLELFRTGIGYFDKGIEASNLNDLNTAKKYARLSLSIFLSSRALDPGSSYTKAFIYVAKGFMYHLSGTQMRTAIRTDSDTYTVLVQLRRAYYPLEHASYYYEHALEYLTDPNTIEYVKGLKARNDAEVKLVKQFLPQVDYKADRFLQAIEAEAQGIVNFDRINDLISEKNYDAVPAVIEKNKKISEKLLRLKSDNAAGFANLTEAYEDLLPVLRSLASADEKVRANAAFLGGKLNACVEYTRMAETGFRDLALSKLCQDLRDNVMKIRASLRKRTGMAI